MKYRKLTVMALVLILSTSVTAVVGQDDPGEGEMAITQSGSTASGTTAVGENGTRWSAKVSMQGRTEGGLDDTVLGSNYSENGMKNVDFQGRITAPTPCHVLEHEADQTGESTYVLNIQTVKDELDGNNIGVCAQVLTTISYDASFETGQSFELEVQHNGETFETFNYPEETEDPEPKVLDRFFGWILNLL